ncbi:sulfite exporter TauE/SafE family protein [Mucilaginibacter rubeus]|uniref:Probable membrane transporter protein n=1 Tax=Mucilaginibacter rubeus TaxID=2027860 RepID=A0AAE6JDJ3_9SPHI|nr:MULTISPECIES: sulfite exporter TauE/SafE family protein [Mucilaginibacter]QEM03744.1 sulfite exporter TauE/SafE family protein [Mucilaginibacter rubeus]QEM16355.1 sulfite exporter TauE/SafE family protein [Mucilaginibacter gossypii]QTE40877.1 sulfite exporter TauE/SafE family protein [Mucilaginibacter rubeus]QTE47480.1 sulfite exporter TauE/SafE family protein [Mucilaginibacter rubeus]QTE58873.1 sulfite exporter TauE/SafE family protein [Mucilaginibacter rubeus]
MTLIAFTFFILAGAYLAGLIGSMTGLGGGFIVIPLLTLLLHVNIHYAVGASLISVIATSSGAGAAYVKDSLSNFRLPMFLEVSTTLGAIVGALYAALVPAHLIPVMIGAILIFSSVMSLRKKNDNPSKQVSKLGERLKLNGTYNNGSQVIPYKVRHITGGFIAMFFAGVISGLLGIGSGALKVFAMDTVMNIPFKVSTSTSSFMIGVTAAAGAVIYFQRGYIDPVIAVPVATGVVFGALTGAKLLTKINSPQVLRMLFAIVVSLLAVQMIYNGLKAHH